MVCSFYFLPFHLKYPLSASGEESSDLQAHNIVFLIMVYRNVIFPLSTPNIYSFNTNNMKQQTGSKQENEYVKVVYCHPAYLTYMQSTS